MRIAGLLMLLSGWGIVLAAIALLASTAARLSFVAAGTAIEVLGLVLLGRFHLALRGERK